MYTSYRKMHRATSLYERLQMYACYICPRFSHNNEKGSHFKNIYYFSNLFKFINMRYNTYLCFIVIFQLIFWYKFGITAPIIDMIV